MATIELYKDKINSMSNYIEQAKSAVSDFCTDLSALKKKVLGINSSVCDGIISKISTSSQTQEQQIAGLEATQKEVNDFIDLTINRDNAAAQEIIKAKKDFYKEYDYLKPDSEKSDWEKFCDTLKDVGEWCKEHWKFIVTVVIVIAAVILLVSGVGTGLGAAILAGACWGAICGAVVGGVAGGIMSSLQGGSFFEGFENGAFDGAIGGAIGGAITGGLTAALGPATTMLQSVARGAGVGALSTGTSNMAVTAINYGVANGTLDGALSEIIMSGIVGLVTGGVIGGVTGGIQFKRSLAQQPKSTYSGDAMSPEDAARYDEFWRSKGIGSDKTWNEFQQANPDSTLDDYLRLVKEQSPWPDGYDPKLNVTTLKEGDTFNMVLDNNQPISKPGGFGLKDDIPNVEFARNDMAIKSNWKKDCGKVVTYRVKEGVELNVMQGPVGPQIDLNANTYLPGNSSITQYDLFNGMSNINRMDFIEYIPGSLRKLQ